MRPAGFKLRGGVPRSGTPKVADCVANNLAIVLNVVINFIRLNTSSKPRMCSPQRLLCVAAELRRRSCANRTESSKCLHENLCFDLNGAKILAAFQDTRTFDYASLCVVDTNAVGFANPLQTVEFEVTVGVGACPKRRASSVQSQFDDRTFDVVDPSLWPLHGDVAPQEIMGNLFKTSVIHAWMRIQLGFEYLDMFFLDQGSHFLITNFDRTHGTRGAGLCTTRLRPTSV